MKNMFDTITSETFWRDFDGLSAQIIRLLTPAFLQGTKSIPSSSCWCRCRDLSDILPDCPVRRASRCSATWKYEERKSVPLRIISYRYFMLRGNVVPPGRPSGLSKRHYETERTLKCILFSPWRIFKVHVFVAEVYRVISLLFYCFTLRAKFSTCGRSRGTDKLRVFRVICYNMENMQLSILSYYRTRYCMYENYEIVCRQHIRMQMAN